MRFQATRAAATEADQADQAAALLALPEIDPVEDVVPAMGTREFGLFAEEVAIQVLVAMAYVGLEDTHDAVVMSCDIEGEEEAAQDAVERVIHFRDEEGSDLPVYVSVGIDGFVFVGVVRDDDSVAIVSPAHTLEDAAALVADVVAAVEREVPRATVH